jgi:hypothetical protein
MHQRHGHIGATGQFLGEALAQPTPQTITRREAPVDVVTTDESGWHDRIVVLDR